MSNINKFSLSEKIILITGAGGKLAKHFIKDFIDCGAKVVGIDITIDENYLDDLKKDYKDKFRFFNCDITDKKNLNQINEELNNINYSPNVLINNAAAEQVTFLEGNLVEFTNFPQEVWDQNLRVNLTGALNITQIFGKNLEKVKSGSVINMSSTYGIVGCDQRIYGDSGLNSSIAYAATKSALIGMTKYLASYWGHLNIRVNAVAPSGVFNNHKDPF